MVRPLRDRLSRNRSGNDGSSGIGSLGGKRSGSDCIGSSNRCRLAIGLILLVAFTADMAGLATAIASLASSVEGASIGSSTLAGNVTKLTTSVTLHGLGLAIAGKVVRTTTLVASSRARTTSETTAEATTRTRGTATKTSSSTGSRASALQKDMVSQHA
jgi:hypothetical protein